MANEQTVIAVTNAITVVLPSVIALVKTLTAKAQPDQPPPTDADILAAFALVCEKSIAADDAWLAAHPVTPPPPVTP
jgi:hypothetical protein